MNENIVKVRGRHGTKSLDITIPAKLSKKFDIHPGDLFKIDVKEDNSELILSYKLIYKSE